MPKFEITQEDPALYREQILYFWRTYLPDTPQKRFEWMCDGNPEGPTVWFFAHAEKTGELVGMISLMPRRLLNSTRSIRAGIMGDFMVSGKCRVFGPALQLPKAVMQCLSGLGFEIIYSIPNKESLKIAERVGFKYLGNLSHLRKPLHSEQYLQKHLYPIMVKPIGRFLNFTAKTLAKETWFSANGHAEETSCLDESFDELWERIKQSNRGVIGDRCRQYLTWRYLQNPYDRFRLITLRGNPAGELLGYIVFRLNARRLRIYDVIAVSDKARLRLIKEATMVGAAEGAMVVDVGILEGSSLANGLKGCFFFDSRDVAPVLYYGPSDLAQSGWSLTNGDRNI